MSNHTGMMDMNMTDTTAHMHHGHHSTTTGMHHGHHGMHTTTMGMHHDHGMGMDPHNMHNMHGNDSCGMGMMMFFHTGNCEYILFETLRTTKAAEMIGACIVIFVLAALYEGLKVLREELLRRAMVKSRYVTSTLSVPANSKDNIVIEPGNKSNGTSMISTAHFIQTILHVLQVAISYALMLVFMTYNAWLCIAIILGAGAGYFLFGWRRAVIVDVNEHCH